MAHGDIAREHGFGVAGDVKSTACSEEIRIRGLDFVKFRRERDDRFRKTIGSVPVKAGVPAG